MWGEALYSEWKVETPTLRSAGWQGASPSEQRGEFLSRGVSSVGRRCGSVAQSCLTLCNPWTVARQPSLSLTISQSLLKLMSIESVMTPNHLILCCPLPLLPSIFPASGSFPMSRLFASGGQSSGASALASVLPINIQS